MHLPHIPWHSVEWGNVPSWISGVLSSVSILLAFYIILRDRRKVEREQVNKLVVIVERRSIKRDRLTHHISLINSSTQPFYDVSSWVCRIDNKEGRRRQYAPTPNQWWKYRLYIRRLRWSAIKGGRDSVAVMQGSEHVRILRPDDEATIGVNTAVYPGNYRLLIDCMDAAGRYWLIDPVTKATLRMDVLRGGIEDWG